MAISINSVLPALSAQEVGGIAPELVLQAGSVVNAQVLKVLSADLVRIAIASLSIDVATEVPLQQGQNLQLAVSQTKDGSIRLALVGQGGDAAGTAADAVTLSPDALANRPTIVVPKNALTPPERAAVMAAAQAAVTQQDSLAPLFANLGAAVSSGNLPPKLQQAIAQVLAQQTSLDQNLDGGDIRTAFQKSGILLEASLATGSLPSGGVPDLKAALIVLRQTLQSALGANAATAPQWNFEIPFATPQGTAMAQFEISRDGGNESSDPAKRAWRARFTLNVEPAGPVHALITLNGDKTFVRMWAERPATAQQLRAGIGELNQALTRAELKPGDILVRDGTPPQPAPARAGHFLDRAT